ncbi:hypothetical protein Y600_5915 [Burkholderia pseudomallei MSHR3709]|nr:hypothetical protein Y600_5915 [Burkholderia pseudomallei MSHR3709]
MPDVYFCTFPRRFVRVSVRNELLPHLNPPSLRFLMAIQNRSASSPPKRQQEFSACHAIHSEIAEQPNGDGCVLEDDGGLPGDCQDTCKLIVRHLFCPNSAMRVQNFVS